MGSTAWFVLRRCAVGSDTQYSDLSCETIVTQTVKEFPRSSQNVVTHYHVLEEPIASNSENVFWRIGLFFRNVDALLPDFITMS